MLVALVLQAVSLVAAADEGKANASGSQTEVQQNVEYLKEKGIIEGRKQNGSVQMVPDQPMTRAELVKMIVVANGFDLAVPGAPAFKDVTAQHWAFRYIETAVQNGMISGYPDGTFRPQRMVSRAEVATMLVKTFGIRLEEEAPEIADLPPGHWANEYVAAALTHGLMEGDTIDGLVYFYPNAKATRGHR